VVVALRHLARQQGLMEQVMAQAVLVLLVVRELEQGVTAGTALQELLL
jgi:hypothetical protein